MIIFLEFPKITIITQASIFCRQAISILTFRDKEVHQRDTGRVPTEHVVAARFYAMNRHAHPTPDLVGSGQLGIPRPKL